MCEAVCKAVEKKKVAHLIYISSDAVYKDTPILLNEQSCIEPSSIHAAMHHVREISIKSFFHGPTTFVRPTLVYGIGDPHNGYGPNKFLRHAFLDEDIILFGEGEELRDHIFIEDVAELIYQIISAKYEGVINAVSGETASFNEIAQFIKNSFRSKSKIVFKERLAPMPHNGFRAFDNKLLTDIFPNFKFTNWKNGITKIINQMQKGG